ncbi:MAG: SUMF1/EgtB/PvdO family nonheme iron enzyme [Candidatus Omnitrophota bacterium]
MSPKILIEQKDAAEIIKLIKSSPPKNPIPQKIRILFRILVTLGVIAGLSLLGFKIYRKISTVIKEHTTASPTEMKKGVVGLQPQSQATVEYSVPSTGGGGSSVPTGTTSVSVPSESMVLIPGGEYVMGWDENGKPVKNQMTAFYIYKYEVTNRQYYDFVKATGYKAPADPRGAKYDIWHDGGYPAEFADHPVVNVTCEDAESYANWRGKRLPTEEEWEWAARGNEGLTYPWGNDYKPTMANSQGDPASRGTTMPVGSFPFDCSSFGVFDMAGNVREWTATPYSAGNKRWKVVKGGSFEDGSAELSTFVRFKGTTAATKLGFRCVKDAK